MSRIPRPTPRPLILALALVFAPHGVQADQPAPTNRVVVSGPHSGDAHGNPVDETNPLPASYNELRIEGQGQVTENAYGGYYRNYGNGNRDSQVLHNILTLDSTLDSAYTTVSGSAHGGYADTHGSSNDTAVATVNLMDNHVNIHGGTVGQNVYGGYGYGDAYAYNTAIANVTATGNHANLSGGDVQGEGYGAYVYAKALAYGTAIATAIATDNHVNIFAFPWVSQAAYGGFAHADAVAMDAGVATDTATAIATDNHVNISGGRVVQDVYGGYGRAIAHDGADFYAAASAASTTAIASATNNHVSLSGSKVGGTAYGGYADANAYAHASASATNNHVNISGSSVVGGAGMAVEDVHGGVAYAYAYADSHDTASTAIATGNHVNISDSVVEGNAHGGSAYATTTYTELDGIDFVTIATTATATDNHVNISDSVVEGNAYGGVADAGSYLDANAIALSASVTAIATGNHVGIHDGTVEQSVYGGYVRAPTVKGTVAAEDNRVNIHGGTVGQHVYGGFADGLLIATTTGNHVNISGGEIKGNVFGGMSDVKPAGKSVTGKATNNTVTLSGQPVFGATSTLYGGFVGNFFDNSFIPASGMDAFSGNTLEIKTAGLTVAGVQNFERLDFYLPSTLGAGGIVLFVTGEANLMSGDGRASIVNVGIDGASSPLRMDDTVILIDAGRVIADGLNGTASGKGMQGVSLLYDFKITATDTQVLATVTMEDVASPQAPKPLSGVKFLPETKIGWTLNPQTKALSEGYLSGLALARQSVDLAAGSGMAAAQDTLKRGGNAFCYLEGGSSRYETGSHVDVDSRMLMTGIAGETRVDAGMLTFSTFLSYGQGDYDTYNSFTNAASVKGHGDTEHAGLGVFARLDLAETSADRPYLEASLQGGRVKTRFRSGDLVDSQGRGAKYDSSSSYRGAHVGGGYIWNFAQGGQLDLYGQLLHVRRSGDSVTLNTGDSIRFKDIESKRLRIGARYSWSNGSMKPYVGLAWEREFDGMAKATVKTPVRDEEIVAPGMKGNTGIVELGLTLTPGGQSPLTVDLGIQGYTGLREGASGSVRMEYRF